MYFDFISILILFPYQRQLPQHAPRPFVAHAVRPRAPPCPSLPSTLAPPSARPLQAQRSALGRYRLQHRWVNPEPSTEGVNTLLIVTSGTLPESVWLWYGTLVLNTHLLYSRVTVHEHFYLAFGRVEYVLWYCVLTGT